MYLNFLCVSGNNLRLNIHSKQISYQFHTCMSLVSKTRNMLASKTPCIAQSIKGVLDVLAYYSFWITLTYICENDKKYNMYMLKDSIF